MHTPGPQSLIFRDEPKIKRLHSHGPGVAIPKVKITHNLYNCTKTGFNTYNFSTIHSLP